jgi:hypothetical protein
MAVQDTKVVGIAMDTVRAMTALLEAANVLADCEERRAALGPGVVTDAMLAANNEIKHLDAATLESVLNFNMPTVMAFIRDNGHMAMLLKIRR